VNLQLQILLKLQKEQKCNSTYHDQQVNHTALQQSSLVGVGHIFDCSAHLD